MPPRANSDRFALASISAPAVRILATVKASAGGCELLMPTLPPVVGMSKVLKLSLRMIGTQCNGPAPDGFALYRRAISGAGCLGFRFTAVIELGRAPRRL